MLILGKSALLDAFSITKPAPVCRLEIGVEFVTTIFAKAFILPNGNSYLSDVFHQTFSRVEVI